MVVNYWVDEHNFADCADAGSTIRQMDLLVRREGRPHQALGYLSPHRYRTEHLQAVA